MNLLIVSRPKPGGGVYIGVPMMNTLAQNVARGRPPTYFVESLMVGSSEGSAPSQDIHKHHK